MPGKRKAKRKAARPKKGKTPGKRATKAKMSRKPVPKTTKKPAAEQCCPNVNLSKWNMREWQWKDKPFYVVKYATFFRMPLNMSGVFSKGMKEIKDSYATPEPKIWLAKDTGLFGAKMLFQVNRAIKGDSNIEWLSGRFVSRGFQGPYSQMGNYIRVFTEQVKQKYKREPIELYAWYTNCPRCAKKQGGPKTVLIAMV